MEGNSSSPYLLDLQSSMHVHHQQHPNASLHHRLPNQAHQQGSMVNPQTRGIFPLTGGHLQVCDLHQQPTLPIMECNKGDHGRTSMSDEDELSLNTEDGADGHNEAGKVKKASTWQRMKWTDGMVKLLITAVSYIGEDVSADCNSRGKRKFAMLQKKGKWKSVSKVLAERNCYVSPQQCEDKFNDLNKRYKRLTDILGRGTSCKVVENPAMLDLMNHLSNKAKDDVRRILSSKHLFYEEMCSYHNGNRLHLPADPALQRSLQLALGSRDELDTMAAHEDSDEDDQGVETDDKEDDNEENEALHGGIGGTSFPKITKQGGVGHEDLGLGNTSASQEDCNRRLHSQGIDVDMNQALPEGPKFDCLPRQWTSSNSLRLEEQRLLIQEQMLEFEKYRFKWEQYSKKKDRELEKMRMENERKKLENERLTLELKRRELEFNL